MILPPEMEGKISTVGMNVYDSLPLKQDEFRLLKLYPASTRKAPVFIELFKINDLPPEMPTPSYDAISYRWGDQTDQRSLTANGQRILVTRSLHTALTCMRDEVSTRILWIDGVCINQNDTTERGQQVLLMGSIFSGAETVRIFVGEAEDGDNIAQATNLLSSLETLKDDRKFIERVKVDQYGSRGLINLLRRPYWQRMWMFQEIVLSRNAVVHCGSYEISWENLRKFNTISANPKIWFEAQVRCDWILELRRTLFQIAHFFISKDEARDIRNILEPTRRLQCTDPRDKLFSLLGVCKTIPIHADYSRSVRDIYTDFTRRRLKNNFDNYADISLLLTAGLWNPKNGPQLNLPSWVPDYRGTHGVDIRYLAACQLKHFNASFDRKPGLAFRSSLASASPNPHLENSMEPQYMLATRGVLIGTVNAMTTLKEVQESPQSLLKLIGSTAVGPQSSGEEHHAQVLFRTTIFDDKTLHEPKAKPLHYSNGSERYIRLALGFAHCLHLEDPPNKAEASFLDSFVGLKIDKRFMGLKIGGRTLRQHYDHLLENGLGELEWHYQEYLIRSNATSEQSSSKFFVTKDNRIGKGPFDSEPGDCVAVIYGCRIPLVLRPSGAHFQLVGPCYMHGAMFGEIIERLSDSGKSDLGESEIILV